MKIRKSSKDYFDVMIKEHWERDDRIKNMLLPENQINFFDLPFTLINIPDYEVKCILLLIYFS